MNSRRWCGGAIPVLLLTLAAASPSCGSATVKEPGGDAGARGSGGAAGGSGMSSGHGGAVQSGGGQSGAGAAGTGGAVVATGGASGQTGGGGQPGAAGAGAGGTIGTGGVAGAVATGGQSGHVGAGGGAGGPGGQIGTAGAPGRGTAGSAGGKGGNTGGLGGGAGAGGGAAGAGGAMPPNVVFVSSRVDLTSNLGSLAAYDGICNQLATAAGINNSTKDAFVALLGDSHTSALSRLGNARGFVRTDGQPVADDVTSLFSENHLFNNISTNEHGVAQAFSAVLTGLLVDGTTDQTALCSDWTTANGPASFSAGCSTCGPPVWYYWEKGTCDFFTGAVYCFMKTHTSPLTITPVAGKRIFLSNSPVKVGQDADAECERSKPTGTGTVKALRATTTAAASTLVAATSKYVRPDGILVAVGSDLVMGKLSSGIWQQGNGAYSTNLAVWTGASDLLTAGTDGTTCANWTSTTAADSLSGVTAGDLTTGWWKGGTRPCNNAYTFAYCVEQ